MKIVYFSLTGNCKKFLSFCKIPEKDVIFLKDVDYVDYEYIVMTPTIGFGEVPLPVKKFLDKNSKFARGVVSSGNRNWGVNFAVAADIISRDYNIPVLMKFELLGNMQDIEKFKKIYEEMSC
ncbi:class Ib ribonucleoside-diphosphate reductase assembly flavoprotein NrdI [Gemella sp. GH3]|uniref:class Ib ribonucleoside-diphosphate reductase assembly flavoprotein NrdI n=1 Tax=unclassified Gemella TaxID=2624949 RepID=UPI0015D0B079|nr:MULTISPECIES: class Ib ribonucleoside-diphosphate reductase assembly flavoprotein NrdI [unclassified Gemella]MBF0713414.1 class Ib ribonucleoside-diphosphate reductase assembly flavoprotein NrdI [Gemella sp. GH3.1]NYS50366.1 class Ib ribonucleoside-diphosphate reductase assembly flavoprotein NrdI [Gemella sp. GH3]